MSLVSLWVINGENCNMKKIILIISFIMGLILLTPLQTKADINYNLIYNWQYQPQNVKNNLVTQNTNIRVVDDIRYDDPTLYDVYGLTTMYLYPNSTYVTHIDVQVEQGHEDSLTHEVGHCISNANHSLYWWCFRPEFIQIWLAERDCAYALMAHGHDDIREYFADAYDLYIRFPQILKKLCPMTYNYMTVVLKYT